jgi:hypothetical protein
VFGHARRQEVNGKWTDIYTDIFKEELSNVWITYQDFEPLYNVNFSPLHSASKGIHYLDIIEILWVIFSWIPINFTSQELVYINQLEEKIEKEFEIKLNMKKMLQKVLSQYWLYRFCFRRLFRTKKPLCIVEVGWYGYLYQALNSSAKEYNIPVVELQHWTLSRYHLWYAYYKKDIIHSMLPDYFFTFGNYRSKLILYPNCINVISTWYPYFELKKFAEGEKDPNALLVISQWAIGKELSLIVSELAKCIDDNYHIYYKLHPGEFSRAKKEYSYLYECDNVTVIQNEKSIYDMFNQCSVQIWVFSTALYEWLGFGLSTILFELPWIEYMESLISSWTVYKVWTIKDFNTILTKMDKLLPIDQKYYFAKDSKHNIVNTISNIILWKY